MTRSWLRVVLVLAFALACVLAIPVSAEDDPLLPGEMQPDPPTPTPAVPVDLAPEPEPDPDPVIVDKPLLPPEMDPDNDDDGVADEVDSAPDDPTEGENPPPGPNDPVADDDNDGLPNVMDPDDSNDGVADADEPPALAPTPTPGAPDAAPAAPSSPGRNTVEPATAPDREPAAARPVVLALPSTGSEPATDGSRMVLGLLGLALAMCGIGVRRVRT